MKYYCLVLTVCCIQFLMSMFIDEVLLFSTGKKNPMKKKKFHELSLYQKVWVLKSLCDHCLVSEVFLFVSEIYIVRIMNVKEKNLNYQFWVSKQMLRTVKYRPVYFLLGLFLNNYSYRVPLLYGYSHQRSLSIRPDFRCTEIVKCYYIFPL